MSYGYDSYGGAGYDGGYGYTSSAPYGHGASHSDVTTASSFGSVLSPGQSEAFSSQSGYRSSSVYAVHDVDGTSYARYATNNAATGLYHVDTSYGHPGPYTGYQATSYYALHADGYAFAEETTSYDYHPGGGEPGYVVDHESKQYSYSDGSSLDIADYFRSDVTTTDAGSMSVIDQSEAETATDAYGSSTYSFTSSTRTVSF